MDTLLQDLRYALRTLLRSPGFALVAIVTLGLGIGANTAVFSLVNAVFFRPLPGVQKPEELVRVFGGERGQGRIASPISYLDYQELAASPRGVFAGVAAIGAVSTTRDGDQPTITRVVSGNYFSLMRLRPALGRGLLPDDDRPAARPVAVVSHDLWTRAFGARGDLLGQPLRLNGEIFTVVGVAPDGFHGTDVEAMVDVWVPISHLPLLGKEPALLSDRGSHWLFPVARLLPGVSAAQYGAALDAAARELSERYPQVHARYALRAFPGGTLVSAAAAPEVLLVFSLLMVVVGAVLCVACANVANLLLARAAARRREIAVRLSLGAGRGRLLRQLLTESLVLGVAGGALGVALAQAAPPLFGLLELPAMFDYSLDLRVLVHAGVMTLLTAALFGLAPALQAIRQGTVEALKEGGVGGGRTGARLRAVLTSTQVALSLALLVAAGLLLRSLWGLQGTHVPYAEGRIAVSFLDVSALRDDATRHAAVERLLEAAARIPGIEAVAVGSMVPMGDHREEGDWLPAGSAAAPLRAQQNVVSAAYFQVLDLPVRAGRLLGPQDRAGGVPVAMVSRSMAAALWPGRSPLGQRLRSAGASPRDYQVVGMVDDLVYSRQVGVQPTVYLSWEQAGRADGVLHTRFRPGTSGLEATLGRAAQGTGAALFGVRTLAEVRRDAAFPQRLTGVLLTVFGSIALLLAAVGLYGVMAYGVAQRTREIGVRVALGARPAQVRALVVRQGVRMAGAGVVAGIALALLLAQGLRSLLFGVRPADPFTFVAVSALLLAVAAAASWIPARRAAALEPMRALRSD